MSSSRGVIRALTAASLVTGGLLVAGCDGPSRAAANAPAAAQPPTVQVIEAIGRALPETASYTGRLAAVQHVDLRPRVGGHIAAVRFREGSIVERGQVLFELDARPFQAAVARAQAQLAQAVARRTLAQRTAARARTLRADDVIAQAELDVAAADEADREAAVAAARALVRAATIDLGDTKVRAPITGRAGEALVTAGNLVSGGVPSAPPLTTIVSVDPLHIELDVDEATFRRLQAKRDTPTPVQVVLADEPAPRTATVDFLGNHVDPNTGTARVRAVIANRDGQLAPGLFARVRIETGAPRDAVLVRDEVIGTSAQGRYVLVVNGAGVVEPRPVQLGESVDGLRVIRTGLAVGERVILKGMARPGMKVTPSVVSTTGGAP